MLKTYAIRFLLFALAACPFQVQAQLFIDDMQYTPIQLATDFFDGTCVDVLSADFQGVKMQMSFFEASKLDIGVNAGIILSSGDVQLAIGPNDQDGVGTGPGQFTPDSLLSMAAGTVNIFDRAVFHLQIVPHIDSIGFQYVFASEEYCEYVNSQFNDVFAFYIAGPGLSDSLGKPVNIALVPGTQASVSINNVNHLTNSGFYVNNTGSAGQLCGQQPSGGFDVFRLQYDGYLKVLTASTQVIPDSVYDVWISVADVSDGIFDSAIFLSVESLCGDSLLEPNTQFLTQVAGNTVTFDNKTTYATSWNWDFGDGAKSSDRYPQHTFADLDNEQYKVTLVASNYCCSDTTAVFVGKTSATTTAQAPICKIYPTNFRDQLFVEPADAALEGELLLTDLSGRLVWQRHFEGKTVVQTGDLPSGAYFLELKAKGHLSQVYKLMK